MRCPLSKVIILSNTTPMTAARQFLQSDLVSGNHMTSLSKSHFVSLPQALSVLSKLAKGKEAEPEAAPWPSLVSWVHAFQALLGPSKPHFGEAHASTLSRMKVLLETTGLFTEEKLKLISASLYKFSMWDCGSKEQFGWGAELGVGFHGFLQGRRGQVVVIYQLGEATCPQKAPGSQAPWQEGPRPTKESRRPSNWEPQTPTGSHWPRESFGSPCLIPRRQCGRMWRALVWEMCDLNKNHLSLRLSILTAEESVDGTA